MLANGVYQLESPTDGSLWLMAQSQLRGFSQHFPEEPALAVFPQWHIWWKSAIKIWLIHTQQKIKGKSILWCAPDEESLRRLKILRIPAALIQNNMLCREDIFRPMQVEKKWDAIHIGALAAYKRHWLAREVESLRVVARDVENAKQTPDQLQIPHASLNTTWVKRQALAEEINASYCGLALSAEEGSMNAATEYLLCGIPVVTTKSLGGRDLWWNKWNHTICRPDSTEVRRAIASWKAKGEVSGRIAIEARKEVTRQRRLFCQVALETWDIRIKEEMLTPENHTFWLQTHKGFDKINLKENPNPKGY